MGVGNSCAFSAPGDRANTGPLFLDLVNGSLHLVPGSPVIDAGEPTAPPMNWTASPGPSASAAI